MQFPDLGQGAILGPVELDIAWHAGPPESIAITYVVSDVKGRYATLVDATTGKIRWIAASDYSDGDLATTLIAFHEGYVATSFSSQKRFGWFGSSLVEGAEPYVGANQPYQSFFDDFHGPGKWVVRSTFGKIKIQPVTGGPDKIIVDTGLGDAFRDPYLGRTRGDDVLVSYSAHGSVDGLGVWNPTNDYVNVFDWPSGEFAAKNVGTDGVDWVWNQGSGYNKGVYASQLLRTAPYSLDSESVLGAAKNLRWLTGYAMAPNAWWNVACGKAALRVTKLSGGSSIWIVRLSDGTRWTLPVGFENAFHLTCDELVATHVQPRYLARVPLASLGLGEPSDL